MRALAIAAALFFMVAPAYAQKKSDEQKKADAARQAQEEQAYKSSLQRIRAKEGAASDPWGDVRGPGDGNAAAQGKPKGSANPAR